MLQSSGAMVRRLLSILAVAASLASDARIEEVWIREERGQILLSFRVEEGWSEELEERLASGLPTGFIFEIELRRDRKRWWDAYLDSCRLERIAMFNAITGEYLLNTKRDGRLLGSQVLRNPEELREELTLLSGWAAFPVPSLPGGSRYLLRVRMELEPGEFLGFLPYERSTHWTESNKLRTPLEANEKRP